MEEGGDEHPKSEERNVEVMMQPSYKRGAVCGYVTGQIREYNDQIPDQRSVLASELIRIVQNFFELVIKQSNTL